MIKLITIIICIWFLSYGNQHINDDSIWINKIDTIKSCERNGDNFKEENIYLLEFKYPINYKCYWSQGEWVIAKESKQFKSDGYNYWGIYNWDHCDPDYGKSGIELLNDTLYLRKFNKDFIEKQDSISISGYKALRVTRYQKKGKEYSQYILMNLETGIFVLYNEKEESNEFNKFYQSIIITRINQTNHIK